MGQMEIGKAAKLVRGMAEKGDPTALKICIDRILPPRKDRPVSFKIPTIKAGQDVVAAIEAAVAAAAGGELTIPEANGVAQIVSAAGHAIELIEIEGWRNLRRPLGLGFAT